MSITLPLTPEAMAELKRRATAAGIDVEGFVLGAVQEKLAEGEEAADDQVSYDEWKKEFHQWLTSHRSRNPHFNDSRGSIYD